MYGSFLQRVRRSAGISQEQLAELVGTSQPTLSAYEHDHKVPSADTLNRILVACGYLLTAAAGSRTISCPLPAGGWFDDEDYFGFDEEDEQARQLAAAERRGRMRHDAPSDDRVAAIDGVLRLAEMQKAVRNRQR